MAKQNKRLGEQSSPINAQGFLGGLWHMPSFINFLADILFFIAFVLLGYSGVRFALRLPFFPIQELVVISSIKEVTPAQIKEYAHTAIKGNFLTINLEAVRGVFEHLPSVRRAQVRRLWPNKLELTLEEHHAVANWSQNSELNSPNSSNGLVDSYGEIFPGSHNPLLPLLIGPQASAVQMLMRYQQFEQILKPLGFGRRLTMLTLSPRQAWQVKLADNTRIALGKDQATSLVNERLARFANTYSQALDKLGIQAKVIDLRYRHGFAVRHEAQTLTVSEKIEGNL